MISLNYNINIKDKKDTKMKTLKEVIEEAEKEAVKEFIKNVPTVRDFLRFYEPIFKKGKLVDGIHCFSDVQLNFYVIKSKDRFKIVKFHHLFADGLSVLSPYKDNIDVGTEKYDEHLAALDNILDKKIKNIKKIVDGEVHYDGMFYMPDGLVFKFNFILEN